MLISKYFLFNVHKHISMDYGVINYIWYSCMPAIFMSKCNFLDYGCIKSRNVLLTIVLLNHMSKYVIRYRYRYRYRYIFCPDVITQ